MYQRSTARRYPCGDGGDSGPMNRRMSTTTSGPRTPVVRRMIPSGSVNCGVPGNGVAHPWSHVPVGGPLVAGDTMGSAGGVGESAGDPGVSGAIGDDLDDAGDAGSSPSHAANSNAQMQTIVEMRNLRNRTLRAVGDATRIPIARILGRTDGHARPSPSQRRGTWRR